MDNKNIIFNHTLEQYNKKYRNRKYRLLKITEKEVEVFDKKNLTNTKRYLLKDRKWWLIKDTYYEIPKPFRFTWFRNLNAACQVGTCLLGAGAIATAVAVPLVLLNNKTIDTINVVKEGTGSDLVKEIIINKDSSGNYLGKIVLKSGAKKADISKIEISVDGIKLKQKKEYEIDYDSGEFVIYKDAIKSNNPKIVFNITLKEEPKVGGITVYPSEMPVFPGQDACISASIEPYTSTENPVWTSSSDKVKITGTGRTVIVNASESTDNPITITATLGDKTSTCKLTVNPAEEEVLAEYEYVGYRFNESTQEDEVTNYEEDTEYYGIKCTNTDEVTKAIIPATYNNKIIKIIDDFAFDDAKKLQTVEFDKDCKIEIIKGYAFENCANLRTIKLPDSIKVIKEDAFDSSGLTAFEYPNNCKDTGYYNFECCDYLNYVKLSDNCETIDDGCFGWCPSLCSFEIPSKVKYIGESALCEIPISHIEIPSSVNSINYYVFTDCELLKSITFEDTDSSWGFGDSPDNVTTGWKPGSESENAKIFTDTHEDFNFCKNSDFSNPVFNYIAFDKNGKKLDNDSNNVDHYEIYSGDHWIPTCMFKTITIPASYNEKPITGICKNENDMYPGGGFARFDNLESVSFEKPENIKSIGDYAFNSDKKLSSIQYLPNLETIGEYAFCECDISEFKIPNSCLYIDGDVFHNCNSLSKVEFADTSNEWYSDSDKKKWTPTTDQAANRNRLSETNSSYNVKNVDIEVPLRFIGLDLNGKKTDVEDNIVSYGVVADNFNKTKSKYTKITIPSTYNGKKVTKILDYAFSRLDRIAKVVFEDTSNIEEIGKGSFLDNASLTSITIPSSVKKIKNYAFMNCNLSTAEFSDLSTWYIDDDDPPTEFNPASGQAAGNAKALIEDFVNYNWSK